MPKSLRIGSSNLNMPLSGLLGNEQSYNNFIANSGPDNGYDGWQLMPVHGKTGLYCKLARAGKVLSLQESWVLPGNIIRPSQPPLDRIKAIGLSALFPSMEASHKYLRRIRRAALPQPPGVLIHPTGQALGNTRASTNRALPARVPKPSYQLTSELLEFWGIPTDFDKTEISKIVSQIGTQATRRGLSKKLVIDTNHVNPIGMEESGRRAIPHIVRLAGALAAKDMVQHVEVSLRPDFGGTKSDIRAVNNAELTGTLHGEILESVAESMPDDNDLLVITEVSAASVTNALPNVSLANFHASLTDQIRAIVQPYIPGTPAAR